VQCSRAFTLWLSLRDLAHSHCWDIAAGLGDIRIFPRLVARDRELSYSGGTRGSLWRAMTSIDIRLRDGGGQRFASRTLIRLTWIAGRHTTVLTRFPAFALALQWIPATIATQKQIYGLIFGVAEEFGRSLTTCVLTTLIPTKEEQEFIDAIKADVGAVLGFDGG